MNILEGLQDEQKDIVTAAIDRPVKVVAGAGTGKTETLTRRFLWLVQEQHLQPARILAVTFTEKAAAEMKARIRAALTRAGIEPEAPLAVYTFHGFARSVLTENCYRRGLPPSPKMLSDVRQRLFLDRLFRRLCSGELDMPSLSPERLAELAPSSLDDLQRALQGILYTAKGKGWSPDEFHSRAVAMEARFYTALPGSADLLPEDDTSKGNLYERLRAAMQRAGFSCRAVEEKNEKSLRDLYFAYEKNARSGSLKPDVEEERAADRQLTGRFIDAGRDFYALYESEKNDAGALDFDDLVNEAVTLLSEPDIRARYRDRFQYVLVDEFQDTSPMQMELIRAVVTPAPREASCASCPAEVPANLTIVGDKKQAIYAWRNARRENMDDILPCPEHTRIVPLTRNHRSRPEILHLANAIRSRVEPNDPESWTKKQGAAVIHSPDPFKGDRKADARTAEADYVAECIQHLMQEDETRRYRDIGVLIRKNSLFAGLRRAFRERGIPYVREGATGLLEEPVCKDVLAYMHAIANPGDDYHLVRVLKRPPVGLSDRDLVRMRYAQEALSRVGRGPRPTLRPFLPLFLHPEDDRLSEGATQKLGDLACRLEELAALQVALPVRDLLERLPLDAGLWDAWGRDDRAAWPDTLSTLQAIAGALEEDLEALDVRDFLDAIEVYASDSRLSAPAAESAMDGVRVLTVHQAKGLEFPIVFVIGMGEKPKAGSGWIWDDAWGVIPAVPEKSAKSVIAKWLRPRKEEGEDEEARCWYVAATRAREALYVTCVCDQHGNPLRPPEMLEHATCSDPLVDPGACTVNVSRPDPERPRFATPEVPAIPGPFTASFSAIESMERCPVGLWIDRHWRLPDAVAAGEGNAGLRIGTLIHEGIACSDLEACFADEDTEEIRGRARALWESYCAYRGPTPVEVERQVRLTVPTRLGDVILSGYIDALVRDGAGLRIVDYKTNRALSEERLEAYSLQMAIYRKALIAEGLAVSSSGLLVHIRPEGCEERELALTGDELDARLQEACEDIAVLLAGPGMPAPRDGRDCRYCGHGDVCPYLLTATMDVCNS